MSHQGTIKRYTLILEKVQAKQGPSSTQILDFLEDSGLKTSKRTLERDFEAIRNRIRYRKSEYNQTLKEATSSTKKKHRHRLLFWLSGDRQHR